MASNRFNELAKASEKKRDILTKKLKKEINSLYTDLYKDLSKKIEAMPANAGQFYLEQIQKELEKEIKKLNKEILTVTKRATKEAAELATGVQNDAFSEISNKYNLGIEDNIFKLCTSINTDVVAEILNGKIYRDRLGISERIWADTKRFNKDIDVIISEGIVQKKGTYAITKDLEKYLNPAHKQSIYNGVRGQANYNAYRLAHTSVIHAYQQAAKRSASKNPYVEGMRWVSAHDGKACDICKERDGKLYKPKDIPLDHAMGRCNFIYEIPMSLDEIGKELRRWVDGEKNPKLDSWFKGNSPKANKKDTNKAAVNKDKNSETDYLKSLLSKGVKVNEESFKNIDNELFKEDLKQLDYLISKYPKVQKFIKKYPFEFKAEAMKDAINATCRTNLDANRIAIVINSKNFDSYKGLFDRAMDSMIKGWHCPKSEDKLTVGTLTHEFGHAIHNVLIREYNNNNQGFEAFKKRVVATKNTKKRSSLASNYTKDIISGFNKEIITIAKEIDPNVNTVISTYGGSSPQEFFAECFANYECGKPNTLGKAMGIFLERNFK